MSLLACLVPRIAANGEERFATQALADLLSASTGVAETFVDVVAPTGIGAFTPGRTTAEEQHGDYSPDLTIRDANGVVRILVENEFLGWPDECPALASLAAVCIPCPPNGPPEHSPLPLHVRGP